MNIIIVENYPIAGEGLRLVFEQDYGIEVLALAADGNEAVELTKKLLPDVVVINLHTNGIDGEYVIRSIKKIDNNFKTLVITSIITPESLQGIIDAGTDALLYADAKITNVINALKAISVNLAVMDEELLKKAKGQTGFLTKREKYIIQSIAAGKTNKEIASECGLKVGTVKNAVSRILRKTSAVSRAQLASMASGLITEIFNDDKKG